MLKPPALIGFLLITAAISWLDRHQNRWNATSMVWVCAGISPGLAWHGWHLAQRGSSGLVMWGGQGFSRVAGVVGDSTGAFTMPLTEVLEGGWPWLLLLPLGIRLAWQQRGDSAGRWELGLLLGSAALVLPLRSQLPWYSHLLWPAIALLCAEGLNQVLLSGRPRWIGKLWMLIGAALLLASLVMMLGSQSIALPRLALICAGAGLFAGGRQLIQATQHQRRRGLITLLIGWGSALLALWHSQLWLWELNESWDPRPVASAIRDLPAEAKVVLDGPTRPSLGWYANRKMLQDTAQIKGKHWVVSKRPPKGCAVEGAQLKSTQGKDPWQLWYCPFSAENIEGGHEGQ